MSAVQDLIGGIEEYKALEIADDLGLLSSYELEEQTNKATLRIEHAIRLIVMKQQGV